MMENNNSNINNSNNSNINNSNNSNNSNDSENNTNGSLYSYSYRNQENQERNPNYYEKKEEENQQYYQSVSQGSDGSRTYRTGQSYGDSQDYGSSRTYVNGQAYESGQSHSETGNDGKKRKFRKAKTGERKKPHGFGVSVAKCAAIALVFGLVSGTVFYGTGYAFDYANGRIGTTKNQESSNAGAQIGSDTNDGITGTNVSTATTINDVADIVENVMPSIVSITNVGQQTADIFGQRYSQQTESAGSGIIIGQTDEEIYIVTNNHVVANSNQLTVNFIDEETVTAEIKGTDASTDLAVLSVKLKDIPQETRDKIKVASMDSSGELKPGQAVVAIGNALGYGQSVTTGVVSALNREVTVQDPTTGGSITNELIQTSAAINPGNSGGALLNMNGQVIGINSVKYSDTNVEGMGFAIPISKAQPIIEDLINREVVDEANSAYLGVSGQDVTSEVSEAYGMPEGVYITRVMEGSAAESAGIQKGDIITKFDDREVSSMEGLQDILQYYAAGTSVDLVIQTNQNGEWQERTVNVLLGKKNR